MFSSLGIPGGWAATYYDTGATTSDGGTGDTNGNCVIDYTNSEIIFGMNQLGPSQGGLPFDTLFKLSLNDGNYISGLQSWNNGLEYKSTSVTKLDSSLNRYIIGTERDGTANFYNRGYVAKFNSSGVLQWQVDASAGSTNATDFRDGTIDSTGSIIAVGYNTASSFSRVQGLIVKYTSAGAISWSRTISFASAYNTRLTNATTDSSDNIYACGSVAGNSGEQHGFIIKYNSSGVFQSQISYGFTAGLAATFNDIAVDSNGDIYAAGSIAVGGKEYLVLAKYNSSFAKQWERVLTTDIVTSSEHEWRSIKIKGTHIYLTGVITLASPIGFHSVYAKYDTSGNLIYTKAIQANLDFTSPAGAVSIDASFTLNEIIPLPSENSIILFGHYRGTTGTTAPWPTQRVYPIIIKVEDGPIASAVYDFGGPKDAVTADTNKVPLIPNIEFFDNGLIAPAWSVTVTQIVQTQASITITPVSMTPNVAAVTAISTKLI
jgi:hypothetical protein